jgi:uncharacterized protein
VTAERRPGSGGQDPPWAIALELALFLALFALVNTFVPGTLSLGTFPLPTRIFLYFAFAWLSLRRRGLAWRDLGLRRPEGWRRAAVLGIGVAIALEAANTLLIGPILAQLTGATQDLSRFANLAGGNLGALVGWLAVTWTLAAFGEELVFRAYLMNRAVDLLGGTRAGWVVSLLATNVIFGLAHAYQGPLGVLLAGVTGTAAGLLYLRAGRNLWPSIVMHGVLDTTGFVTIFVLYQCCAGAMGR